MSEQPIHRRYVMIFAVACLAILLPVLVLNYLLGLRSLGGVAVVLEASRWQQETRGVTYAPPLSANRPFKSARLFDRLPEINAVVFGSSTAMSITQEMFPPGVSIYNFSQTGNELPVSLGEAEFMVQSYPGQWKLMLLPLDWALGFVFRPPTAVGAVTVAAPDAHTPQVGGEVRLTQQLQDALSLPRVKNLFSSLAQIVRSPAPVAALQALLFGTGGEIYRCPDGIPARDFDTIFRGTCTGFRYDGSATFANLEPVPVQRVETLIGSAVVPSSKYAIDLIKAGGVPQPQLLERLTRLAQDQRAAGGRLLLILPPLLPGMERAFLASPRLAPLLMQTKRDLAAWAQKANAVILDAGQSERYGCIAAEFVDEHHALPACYARIFARFWAADGYQLALVPTTKIPAGLYVPD